MQTVALSESAVAVFRLRVKGLRMPPTERRLPAYRELVEAGIMEPDGEGFGFTAQARERREERKRVANRILHGLVAFPGREALFPGDGHEDSTWQAERSPQRTILAPYRC